MEKLSIIIPTLQKNKKLLDMLICQLDKESCVGEIIVIDNSLKGYNFKSNKLIVHIPESNLYVNPAWNLGIEKSQYKFFGILNDDLLLPENLLPEILTFLSSNKNIGLVGVESSSVINNNKRIFSSIPNCNTKPKYKKIDNIRKNKDYYWGCAIFGHKENYYPIPDDIKIYCGDDYLLYQNAKNGNINYAFYNTIINHCHSLSSSAKEFEHIIRNDIKNYSKIDNNYKKYLLRKNFIKVLQTIFSVQNTKNKQHKVFKILGLKIKIKHKPEKPFRFLVHLHLYYHDQVEFMLDKLKNISNCDWDLYVTTTETNDNSIKKILEFKPDAKIQKVANLGCDIWPFIQSLRDINLENYDYILKIHTKNIYKTFSIVNFKYKGRFLKGTFWRDQLLHALIFTKKRFKQNIKLLSKNENIGMIVNKTFMLDLTDFMAEDTYLLEQVTTRLNIKSDYKKFLAGTMFIIKADTLKKLVNSDITEKDFIIENNTYTSGAEGQFVHAIERIFTKLTDEAGYQIYQVPNLKMEIYRFFRTLIRNIFTLENTRNKSHKILTIIGFKVKFKQKRAFE